MDWVLYFSSVTAFVWHIILSLFVYFKSPQKRINIDFALIGFSFALWTVGDFFYFTLLRGYGSSINWMRVSHLGAVFFPLFLYSFICELCRERINRFFIIFLLLLALFFEFANFFTVDFFTKVTFNPINFTLNIEIGQIYYLFMAYVIFVSFACVYKVFLKHRNSIGNFKLPLQYWIVATVPIFLTIPIYFPALFGFKVLRIDNLLHVIYASIVAIAITKTRLMDISVIIGRTAAYIITILVFGIVYLFFALGYRSFISANVDIGFLGITIIYGILVGEFFQHIRFFVQTSAEKAFLKGKHDYRKVLSRMSKKLSGCKTMGNVKMLVEEDLKEELDLEVTNVYLIRKKGADVKRYVV